MKIGVIMDPIESIKPYKDSTFAMMLAAQKREWELHYLLQSDIAFEQGEARAGSRRVSVTDRRENWFELGAREEGPLNRFDVMLMRVDPPFNMEYIYTTYLLEQAQEGGTLVINNPQALRDVNEKFFTTYFPQCLPETIVSRDPERFKHFLSQEGKIVVKPLDGMGGASIFQLTQGDPNTNVILETLLENGTKTAMAQRFLSEYRAGDKRILLINGEPVPYALARLPAPGESRANLAAGGSFKGVPLTERDRWICAELAPELKRRGLIFVGIDVIGDYLTEINVTSPTCIRELDDIYGLDIGGDLMDWIEKHLERSKR
ncbi:MAG: glutathione synthase [Thiotrichales bacterium]